jgi:membrane protein YqaA with SNARE-associated domain
MTAELVALSGGYAAHAFEMSALVRVARARAVCGSLVGWGLGSTNLDFIEIFWGDFQKFRQNFL